MCWDAVLLLVSATALVAVALFSIRERLRDFAVLKAVGFTPRQVAATLAGPAASEWSQRPAARR